MRPVSDHSSALRNPLNEIMGYQANVRLLRTLVETGEPLSYSELAKRTGLSLPGIHKVVPRLTKTGIIQFTGSGKQQQIGLREEYPLFEVIKDLFNAEKEYFDDLIKRLKEAIENLELKPKSAWIFGKVAQGTEEYGDPIRVAFLGDVKTIDELTDQFRDLLIDNSFEKEFDVTIDIKGLTVADLESNQEIKEDKIILLWGPDPRHYLNESINEEGGKRTHRDLDKQSLTDSKAWTELLRTHPEIIPRTIDYLEERISQVTSGEKKELQEWKHILESMSYQRLKKFLKSDSERSTRLRQSLPFWPVLNESEKTKLGKIKSEQGNNYE